MPDFCGRVLTAELIWTGEKFEQDIQIRCGNDGKIVEIGKNVSLEKEEIVRLTGQALLPGFVNAHSHAFHRSLRGSSHIGTKKAETFWGWRDEMYDKVEKMTVEELFFESRRTFDEMLRSGITTVGEFHYIHHDSELKLYNLDRVLLKAAESAGIRVVLLETFYERAGLKKQELRPAQKKFAGESVDCFWRNFNELTEELRPTQTMGIAAHSIRTVSLENIRLLKKEADYRHIPFHMHLEEQPLEISDSKDVLGMSPAEFVINQLNPNHLSTFVHCTFTTRENVLKLLEKDANICICPLTEGYLGDGIPNLPRENCINLCLGTDCNNRLSMVEEMRWLVYCQQMKCNKRGICGLNAKELLRIATKNGAKSLGLGETAGQLTEGRWLDFVSIDMTANTLLGLDTNQLLDGMIFGGGNGEIRATAVAGRIVYSKNTSLPMEIVSKTANLSECTELPQFLMSLMAINSTTGQEGKLATELAKYLQKHGWLVKVQPIASQEHRLNLLATRNPFIPPGPRLIFNSHLDTVPPFIGPKLSDDKSTIRGRGSNDAKGQIATMVFAAEEIVKIRPDLANNVGLLFVVGEETDHQGIKESNHLQLKPDFLIVGEPTELKFAKLQKGVLKMELKSWGNAAHSGYPQMGKSAIDPLLDVIQDLRNEQWPSDPELGETTLNIGMIRGGQAANVLASSASAFLMFRLVSPPEKLLDRIVKIVDKRVEINDLIGMNAPVHLDQPPPGLCNDQESIIVAFNTDIAYFKPGLTCKSIYLFGPGSIIDAHSEWEFVKVDDLYQAVRVHVRMVKWLLAGEYETIAI